MNKSTAFGIVAALAIGAGVFYLVSQKPPPKPSQHHGAESKEQGGASSPVPETAALVAPAGDLGVPGLSSDVTVFFQITPANFEPLFANIRSYVDKLRATSAWKKLDGDKQLSEQFRTGLEAGLSNQTAGAVNAASVLEAGDYWLNLWGSVKHAHVAASSHTFVVKDQGRDLPLPTFFAEVVFQNDKQASDLFGEISKAVLKGKDRLEEGNTIVEKRAGGAQALDITIKDKQNSTAPAALWVEGPRLRGTFGARDAGKFFSSDPSKQLFSSAGWKSVMSADASSSAMTAYAAPAALMRYADTLFASAPPSAEQTVKAMNATFAPYRDIENASFTSHFDNHTRSSVCVTPVAGSPLAEFYGRIDAIKAKDRAPLRSFEKLIEPDTLLALRFSTIGMEAGLDKVMEQITHYAAMASQGKDAQDVQLVMVKLKEFVDRFGFREVGIFAGPPIMPPIIGAGLYLGSSSLSGEKLVQELAKSINELAAVITSAADGTPAKLSAMVKKDSEGRPAISLNIGGMMLTGGLAGDNSIIFSIDESLVHTFAGRVSGGASYLGRFSSPPEIQEYLGSSDYYVFLNTKTLIDLSKSFIPMLLVQQTQEPKLEQQDVEQVLELLKLNYLSLQLSKHAPGGAMCSESHGFLLGS